MALDADPFMRLGTRGSPSWPGLSLRPDTLMQTDPTRSLEALADGAGHTLAQSPTVEIRAQSNRRSHGEPPSVRHSESDFHQPGNPHESHFAPAGITSHQWP